MKTRRATARAWFAIVLAAALLHPSCGGDSATPTVQFTVDPKTNTLLLQQSQTLGDVSTVLKSSNLPAEFNLSSTTLGQLKATNSPLLTGANPPVQASGDLAIFSVPLYQERVDGLMKQAADLSKQVAEQQAFIKLSEPEVRALEKALGVTTWDKWLDRIMGFLLGLMAAIASALISLSFESWRRERARRRL